MSEKNCILVVDDDEGPRKSLSLILKRKGYEVESAGTGKDALEKARGRTISLALLDIKLPDTDGVDLIAPLKTIEPEIVILMVTGFASVENTVRSLNAGAAGYLVKPINHEEMLGKIQDLLERQDLIRAKRRAEDLLRESEERYRLLLRNANDGIFVHEITPEGPGKFIEVNDQICRWLGYSRQEMLQMSATDIDVPEQFERIPAIIHQLMTEKRAVFETEHLTKDKKRIPVEISANIFDLNGRSTVLSVIRNITERKRADETIRAFSEDLERKVIERTSELSDVNLKLVTEIGIRINAEKQLTKTVGEKEVLLREVHHRVKNNLQIILSLIDLQSRNIKDQKLLETMGEFQNRIIAMAHVHERMCRADDISRIDLSEIVIFLGTALFKSYKVDPHHIRLNVEMKDLQITIDSAIPISLIINELVSNSIKHAFPKGTPGEITIAGCREADTLVLSIRDTGIVIPKDLDWMGSQQTLGLRLVVSLVEQLNGTIELDRTAGTTFNIVVKEK
jgi:PAS domain S-box-containing protein